MRITTGGIEDDIRIEADVFANDHPIPPYPRGLFERDRQRPALKAMAERRFALRTVVRRVPVLLRFGEFARQQGAATVEDLPACIEPFVAQWVAQRIELVSAQRRKIGAIGAGQGSGGKFFRPMIEPAGGAGTLKGATRLSNRATGLSVTGACGSSLPLDAEAPLDEREIGGLEVMVV